MRDGELSDARFRRTTLALTAFYAAVETLYVLRLPLISDEFQNAETAYSLLARVPYRDFAPYKTVLGYYAQLPLLAIAPSTWTGLMLVKLEAVALTTVMIYVGARTLARHFDRLAVVLALALFVIQSTFLERSGDLRVDMLTSVAGFAGFLLLLNERYAFAGVLTAISFFISQKGAYYVLAAEAAFVIWLMQSREWKRVARAALIFNVAMAIVTLAYVGTWSVIASTKALVATVPPAAGVALETYTWLPRSLHAMYWPQVLMRDPVFWMIAVAGMVIAGIRLRGGRRADAIVLGYGAFILAAAVWHKQPWPYFFVIVIPTLFVAGIPAFEALIAYCRRADKRDVRRFAIAVYVVAVLLSLSRFPVALARSNAHQRHTVRALELLLEPGDAYYAGLNILYRKKQALPDFAWLENPDYERQATYSRAVHEGYLRELERSHVKLVVHTFFLEKLPPLMRTWFRDHYEHLWSHLDVYAPKIAGGRFELLFAGRYHLKTTQPHSATTEVMIDGQPHRIGELVALRSGWHSLGAAAEPIRFKLIPAGSESLDPRERAKPDSFIPLEYYRW